MATYASTDGLDAFGAPPDAPLEDRMKAMPQYQKGGFVNDEPRGSFASGKMLSATWDMLRGTPDQEPAAPLPMVGPEDRTFDTPPESGLRITWLGHSTLIVEIDGARILTDPVWAERASPSKWAGPARFHAPPIALKDLPPIDAIILSHDHYDHLDMDAIRTLGKDTNIPFYAPLGVGAHIRGWGVPTERVTELAWWEKVSVKGVQLVATPARHFSGRGLLDRNKTLWTSWAMVGPEHRVYFSGDTGPTKYFKEIGDKLGPFDVTMLEVGAWNAAWGDIHLGPYEAAKAHLQLRGKSMLPVHWGTFPLANHAWYQPAVVLAEEAEKLGITLLTPGIGGQVEPPATDKPWWPALVRGR